MSLETILVSVSQMAGVCLSQGRHSAPPAARHLLGKVFASKYDGECLLSDWNHMDIFMLMTAAGLHLPVIFINV